MTPRKIFSVPLNPKLNEKQFELFYNFLNQHKDWIYDVYFTSRMPPFFQDAMGDTITTQENAQGAIENAIGIKKYLGIEISATFNNTVVPPTQKNLDTFINSLSISMMRELEWLPFHIPIGWQQVKLKPHFPICM